MSLVLHITEVQQSYRTYMYKKETGPLHKGAITKLEQRKKLLFTFCVGVKLCTHFNVAVWSSVHTSMLLCEALYTLQYCCVKLCTHFNVAVWSSVHTSVLLCEALYTLQCCCVKLCTHFSVAVWSSVHTSVLLCEALYTFQCCCVKLCTHFNIAMWSSAHTSILLCEALYILQYCYVKRCIFFIILTRVTPRLLEIWAWVKCGTVLPDMAPWLRIWFKGTKFLLNKA